MKNLTLIDKAFLLKRTPPFSSLNLDLLLAIADKLVPLLFEDKDVIFDSGEEANRMYFIASGKIKVEDEKSAAEQFLETGNFFGEESLFNNQPRKYTTTAVDKTQLLALTRTNLYTIISECPSVAVGFLQVYTSSFSHRPLL